MVSGFALVFLRLSRFGPTYPLPPEDMSFDVRIETQHRIVFRNINRILSNYKDGHHGPTVVLVQAGIGNGMYMYQLCVINSVICPLLMYR